MNFYDELPCDIAGRCEAHPDDRPRGVSSCNSCGKQLELINGQWWTWDVADDVRAGDRSRAQPQHEGYP